MSQGRDTKKMKLTIGKEIRLLDKANIMLRTKEGASREISRNKRSMENNMFPMTLR